MYKVAIIGMGRISQRHIQSIEEHPKLKLEAVCDLVEEKINKAGLNIGKFLDYHPMIRTVNPDIISVLTEAGNHAHIVKDIAKYGKHIIVEKPIALTLKDADDMIEECDRYSCKLFVVKQNRYNLPIIRLKEALDKGRFGKLILGTIRLRWCRHEDYFEDPWRGTWKMDGGVFASQASHHVDMLRWMFGAVKSVMAMGKTQLLPIEVEDTGIVLLEFVNGALGIIEATNAARPENIEGSISVLGELGTVVVGGRSMNKMDFWKFVDPLPTDEDECSENPPDIYGFGHKRFYKNVVENIETDGGNIISGLEGRRTLELITAIYEAIEKQTKIYVGFYPERCRLGK